MKMANERLYQDIWIKGQRQSRGVRDCETGYQILFNLAQRFKRPFTMLDIGANYGYFSTRLAEDFDCCCVAVEPEADFAQKFFELNENHKVILLRHEFNARSLAKLARAEHFDIVLAYGVIHWLPLAPLEALAAITALGDYSLIELPFEENDKTVGREKMRNFNSPPFIDYQIVGHMKSHLALGQRKVILIHEPKQSLTRKHVLNAVPIQLQIKSSLTEKIAIHPNRQTSSPWVNGINLMTLIGYNCCYPTFDHIKQCLQVMPIPEQHGDIRPWNVIFDGQRTTLIDCGDPWPASNDKRDIDLLLNCNSYDDLLLLHLQDKKIYV